ncbi:K-box region and MADS-box transcription factor family protein [Tanacetum coccineum]
MLDPQEHSPKPKQLMGRRKLELKRIEDKSSRQVTFSKRRTGLIKKTRHLSVLCDVDIVVLVFSARDKLYEACFGTRSNSVEHILSRYQKSCIKAGDGTNKGAGGDLDVFSQGKKFRTCKELLQTVDRLVEENSTEDVSVTDMIELEQELVAALVQTRLRKRHLDMGAYGAYEHVVTYVFQRSGDTDQVNGKMEDDGWPTL